jgi:sterol-4alpha-carboxylate 3-dehydrogenase (decarboxylating)
MPRSFAAQRLNNWNKSLPDVIVFTALNYLESFILILIFSAVARAELLCAHGLLDGINNPNAPKIDGEAFNITDDEPSPPWSFFRMYWMAARDKTPLSSIWMFPPWFALWLTVIAVSQLLG